MKNILVAGASGLLGLEVFNRLSQRDDYQVYGTYHRNNSLQSDKVIGIDLTKYVNTQSLINVVKPDVIINCAAETNVEKCEKDREGSFRINVDFPAMITDAAYLLDIHLIQISTPAVFDGEKGNYTEEDLPNPINIYGRQKLEAERIAASVPKHTILRADFYGLQSGLGRFLYDSLHVTNIITGYTDILFSPISVKQYSAKIEMVIDEELFGIFHSGGPSKLTKYGFSTTFADELGFAQGLIKMGKSNFSVPRPKNTTLDSSKLYGKLCHKINPSETTLKWGLNTLL